MRKAMSAAILAACALAAWPCAAETGVTPDEILLGSCNALSGPNDFFGKQLVVGANAYFKTINAQGGVHGRKIRLLSYDDKYEPDWGIACYQKLLSDGVFATTLHFGSALLAKYVPMARANKVPAVGFYSGPLFVSEPVEHYIFAARTSFHDEMSQTVDHLWNDLGVRKIAVIYQNDAYGADLLEGIRAALKAHDAQPVALGSYTRNVNNIAEAFNTVKAADPQAVILAAVYGPCAEAVKLSREAGWNPIFVMNSGTGTEAFIKQAGQDAEGKLITEVFPPHTRTDLPAIVRYRAAMQKYYPNEARSFASLRGYMNAVVIAEGLKRAGKDLTREGFVTALEGIHGLDVGLGKEMALSYGPDDHLGFHKVFFTIVRDGKVVSFNDWKKFAVSR